MKLSEIIKSYEEIEAAKVASKINKSKTSKKPNFKQLIKNFLTSKGMGAKDLNLIQEQSNNSFFNTYSTGYLVYKFLINNPKIQDQFLNIFANNNYVIGLVFCFAAKNKKITLLKKIEKYHHLDFSSAFIDFYVKKNLGDCYTDKNIDFFYDIVLTNQYIKKFLEDCSDYLQDINKNYPNNNTNYDSFIFLNKNTNLQTISFINDYNFAALSPPLFQLLKKHSFDMNKQNQAGNTPAHIYLYQLRMVGATGTGLSLVQIHQLIKNGADITIKNQKNLSFIDLWQSDKIKAIIDKIKKNKW